MTQGRTIEVSIPIDDELQEVLIAELVELDFEAFQQEEGTLKAYIPADRWNDLSRQWLEDWMIGRGFAPDIQQVDYEPTNWNERWEATVQPVVVPPFLVKPTWADIPEEHRDKILLEVDPKMSFGTGYHESTRLMLRLMAGIEFGQARVLDAGTGTGILAIAAAKLGASRVFAFDIDEWSFENGKENVILNGVENRVEVRLGGMDMVPSEETFDVVLANIQLNVLVDSLPVFRSRLASEGILVMSGLMLQDRARMKDALSESGFRIDAEGEEGEWWAVAARP